MPFIETKEQLIERLERALSSAKDGEEVDIFILVERTTRTTIDLPVPEGQSGYRTLRGLSPRKRRITDKTTFRFPASITADEARKRVLG